MGTVIALKQHLQTRETAVDAFRNGDFTACLSALHRHDDAAGRCLAARAALRLERPEFALGELARLEESELLTGGRAECAMLRAEALTALGRFDEAREALETARIHAYGTPSAALEAEVELALVRYAFATNDFPLAERAARAALAVEASALDTSDYLVPLEHSRARAMHSLGVLDAVHGRYREQWLRVRAAIAELRRAPFRDAWTFAMLLMNLSFYVRDFDLEADAVVLREEVARAWPADLDKARYFILRSLGWSAALRGNHVGAFREFRLAAAIAPTPALQVWAFADRAHLGRELGEPTLATDELERAADLADRIDWDTVTGDERAALLHLAKQTAAVAPERARTLFTSYRRLKNTYAPHLLNRFDVRLRAHECFADGIICRAEDAPAAARCRLAQAFEIWDGIGYRWKAATAAVELAELGAGRRFQAYAEREGRARPGSWLARRAALSGA